ncbi:glycoside hydrolase superfamily [Aspergillus desertorum]
MAFFRRLLGAVTGFALLQSVCARLDLSSNSTIAVYWGWAYSLGQNSFRGTGGLTQQRLGKYCEDSNIDVIVLAFLMTINGPGGAPEIDFPTTSETCSAFNGTDLKNENMTKFQATRKPILLPIGRATYSEGGEAVVDGFDFDFEAAVTNIRAFATKLRALPDADTSKKYYLTAAPKSPYPDAADRGILNTDSSAAIGAVFVQLCNNYCWVNAYSPPRTKVGGKLMARSTGWAVRIAPQVQKTASPPVTSIHDVWGNWALTQSKDKNARVFLGVPANTGTASTGHLPAGRFESFGRAMMWDVSQTYGNSGLLDWVDGTCTGAGVSAVTTAGLQVTEGKLITAGTGCRWACSLREPRSSSNKKKLGPLRTTTGGGDHRQNQDQGDDQDRPFNLPPPILDSDNDLDWIQI